MKRDRSDGFLLATYMLVPGGRKRARKTCRGRCEKEEAGDVKFCS